MTMTPRACTRRLRTRNVHLYAVPLLVVGLVPAAGLARTWQILNDGGGDAPTIQAGIDSAAAGDTELVGPGTYLENLTIVTKDLVMRSEQGPEATILDGSCKQESVIYLSGQTRAMVVEGFKITGGVGHLRGSISDGGGIHLANRASPTIRDNHIIGNGVLGVTFFGGGVVAWTDLSSPVIDSNLFEANTARLGGAISLTSGNSEIRSNIFRQNSCPTDGGAVYAVFNSGSVKIEGNQFWNNYAGDHGGGVGVGGTSGSEIRIAFNLFVRNQAEGLGTGDTGAGGAMHVSDIFGSIVNNTIVEGLGPSLSTGCEGGGISLEQTSVDLDISLNIIALNDDCGMACRFTIQNSLGQNLFWMNENADLGFGLGRCPAPWADDQIFANPYFCSPQSDDYSLAENSPALGMGAFPDPVCPPVEVRPLTWGGLKARYR